MGTPFTRLFRRLSEKLDGTWNEGPELPPRMRREILDFANENPRATRAAWRAFCERVAETCWRAGHQRGFEHSERELEPGFQRLPPEIEADALDPDWRHPSRRVEAPGFENPLDLVEDSEEPAAIRPREDGRF
jgi:hypothetical protein